MAPVTLSTDTQGTESSDGPLPCRRDIDVGGNDFSLLLKETDGAGVLFFMIKGSGGCFGVCCFHIFLHGQREQVRMRHFLTRVTF